MVKRIRWNKRAIVKLDSWVDYLETEFSFQSAKNLLKNIKTKIELIEKQPTVGRTVKTMKTIRFVNIDGNRQLFYRVHGSIIYITDFFDVRQSPKKRPYS